MRLKVVCVLCLAVLVLAPLTGCGAAVQKAAEKATGVDVNNDGNKVTITGNEGDKVEMQGGDDVSLPDGFPKDVPLYEGAKLIMSNSYTTDGNTAYTAVYETSDDVATVHAWYKDALPKAGWTIEGDVVNSSDGSSMAVIGAKKGDTTLNVAVGDSKDNGQDHDQPQRRAVVGTPRSASNLTPSAASSLGRQPGASRRLQRAPNHSMRFACLERPYPSRGVSSPLCRE